MSLLMLHSGLVTRVLRHLVGVIIMAGAALAATAARPNVIIITVDTTRADRMGFLGSQRGLTPNLDAVARQGVVFGRAYSHVPLTTPSHTTIFTGTYPQFNHIDDFGIPLGKDLPFLPQILHDQGYKTAAFVGSVVLDPLAGGAPGFDRGFDLYDAGFHRARPGEEGTPMIERRGGEVVDRALAWLAANPAQPFFVWIHLYDPHIPYEPPEPFLSRYPSTPYDGEIAYADSVLGILFDQLRSRGLYDGTLIAMAADHGEAFGEHGERTHGIFLYDETIHVPLLFKMPDKRYAGQRVDTRAGLVDILPTVLEVVGLPTPKEVQGESLVALMNNANPPDGKTRAAPDRPAYAETDYPHHFGATPLRAMRTGKYLFVEAPRKELYDQSTDPGAERNLSSSSPAVTQALTSRLDTFRDKTRRTGVSAEGKIDPQLAQQLAALGYVSSSDTEPSTGTGGADPKDKIEFANLLQDALLAEEDGRTDQAIQMLQQVLAKEPNVEIAYATLGHAYRQQKDYDKALWAMRKAVELRPNSVMDHYELGMTLFAMGDYAAAKTEFETAFAKSPSTPNEHSLANLHFTLAAVYDRMGRGDEAVKELKMAIQLEPNDYDSNSTLGRVLLKQGNAAAALPYLQKALEVRPNFADAHYYLADAYFQLGQPGESLRERLAGKSLQGFGK
jgi:arylsulfatase A-like enzyme/Tfp pilus assembly protein PilF